MKKSLLLISVIVAIALLLSSMQVLAAPLADKPTPNVQVSPEPKGNDHAAKKGKPQNFKGIVSAKTETGLTLTLKDGKEVSVAVSDQTKIHIPTLKDATLADINLQVQAAVQARPDSAGNLVAQKIQVVPGKPTKIHRVGTVTVYTPNSSITIQAKDGSTFTFALTAETKILPAGRAGSLGKDAIVTIISPRDPTGDPLTAQGIVIHGGKDAGE